MEAKQIFTVKLLERALVARDILVLKFQKPLDFSFKAGQFVQFFIPNGLESVLRSYSIASAPEEEVLEFCVKLLPEGKGSSFFKSLNHGESAQFKGPEGRFICVGEEGRSKLFVATGAGIAPIMSMLKDESLHTTNINHLVFGVRSEEDLFWIDRLEKLSNDSARFHFQITLSQPSSAWNGLVGRVTELVSRLEKEFNEYYLCGSLEMVKDIRSIFLKKNIEPKRIHLEIF